MDDFLCEAQCDEQYIPTQDDWLEYQTWLDSFENVDEYPECIEELNETQQ